VYVIFLCMCKPIYHENLKLFPLIKRNILINESKSADVLVFFNQILKKRKLEQVWLLFLENLNNL
jgi:hypothetical protein